jgi:hypothetical protein
MPNTLEALFAARVDGEWGKGSSERHGHERTSCPRITIALRGRA